MRLCVVYERRVYHEVQFLAAFCFNIDIAADFNILQHFTPIILFVQKVHEAKRKGRMWYNKVLMKVSSSVFVKGIRGTDPITAAPGAHYAFVGRSNVGKSSLINALCNKRALVKVSHKPGKTLEINFFLINGSAYFVDLPGYGYARVDPDEKEKLQKLIVWYLANSGAKPRLVVLVLDSKVGITDFDRQMLEILAEQNHPFILAANKIDKLTQKEAAQRISEITKEAEGAEVIPTSNKNQAGVKLLLQRLV